MFRLTNCPEIHSLGYHFKFDINECGSLGYAKPTWCGERALPISEHELEYNCNTKIVLPLMQSVTVDSLRKTLEEHLHPSILLFLHKVRCIKIQYTAGISHCMRIENRTPGEYIVSYNDERWTYFVERRTLDTKKDIPRSFEGCGDTTQVIPTTEICIALPVDNAREEHVFAFLPVRSYGFRFILQADWLLPSNRQDIVSDILWNQWLAENVPDVFRTALAHYVQFMCAKRSPIEAQQMILTVIPNEENVQGFFKIVAKNLRNCAQEVKCVLVGNDNWVTPSSALLAPFDFNTDKLIAESQLQEHLGLHFVNKEVAKKFHTDLKKILHVNELGLETFIQLASTRKLQQLGLPCLCNWLVWLVPHLRKADSATISRVNNVPLILLSSSDWACSCNSIFFPCSWNSDEFFFLKRLNIVSSSLLECAETNGIAGVRESLTLLGVKEPTPQNIILEVMKTIDAIPMDSVLNNFTHFLKENSDCLNLALLDTIRTSLPLLTNNWPKNSYKLHLSSICCRHIPSPILLHFVKYVL